jgi:polyhydroxybutyrate depolymerase
MRLSAMVSNRNILGLVISCATVAFACGGQDNKAQEGAGGTGDGGASGSGGTTMRSDASVPSSGGAQGSGGTTTVTPDAAQGGAGGTAGSGGSTRSGSGGATTVTGGNTGQPGNGGGSGRRGSGGASANGGRTGGGGAQATGGAAGGAGGDTQPAGTGGTAGGGSTGTSSPPVPSAGCGKTPPASGTKTIDVGTTSREYIIKIPDGYDMNHPYRLVFGFHGGKYDDKWVAEGGEPLTGPYFGIESESKGSTIFVAPQANPTWSSSDLTFVDAMLERFESELCIDKSRIFSVGFSMGAIMTLNIGCNRSEVFRGIAPMSGSLPSPCPTGQHIAYWASHGTNDPTIKPSEGEKARDEFVKRNHCSSQTSDPDANNCITYEGCDAGYSVIWCTFSGVHEPAPFASPAIWKFLEPL